MQNDGHKELANPVKEAKSAIKESAHHLHIESKKKQKALRCCSCRQGASQRALMLAQWTCGPTPRLMRMEALYEDRVR